jgi:hypothetical protein
VSYSYPPTVSCPGVENSQAMQSGPRASLMGGFAGGVTLYIGRLKDSCALFILLLIMRGHIYFYICLSGV